MAADGSNFLWFIARPVETFTTILVEPKVWVPRAALLVGAETSQELRQTHFLGA